jgi:hypothetical protein
MQMAYDKVIVFDDASTSRSTVYTESAIAAVREAGFEPESFDELRDAERFLRHPDEQVRAMICSLGSKSMGSFSAQYPAEHLLVHARFRAIPVALMSGSPYALNYVRPDKGDVIVPKRQPERITPILVGWLSSLATGQTASR